MMEMSPFTPLKLLAHRPAIEAMLRGEWCGPVSVEFDLTNVCNHHCGWCAFAAYRAEVNEHLPTAVVRRLLQELRQLGTQSVTFTGGGEPLLHPDHEAIFTETAQLGLRYGVVTNGSRLTGKTVALLRRTATFVRVSLDAGTAQTHQLLHATARPEFERILDQIAACAQPSRTATVGVSFCVFDMNFHELPLAAERVQAAGADYLEVRPVLPTLWRGGGQAQVLTGPHVRAAQRLVEEVQAEYHGTTFRVIGSVDRRHQGGNGKAYGACWIGPLTTVIGADGQVYHCCQQRGLPAFAIGKVIDQRLQDIWGSSHHQELLATIDVTECPPCRYDGYNQIIEGCFAKGDAMHLAFL